MSPPPAVRATLGVRQTREIVPVGSSPQIPTIEGERLRSQHPRPPERFLQLGNDEAALATRKGSNPQSEKNDPRAQTARLG